jgi:hypothetical protein
MPEKSGKAAMDAALCGPLSAGPAATGTGCPQAGLAAAAIATNVANKNEFRCAFMSNLPT